ncbi:hypothetical protein WP50_24495 [Lactiplantibacillus plantarum]|nr:hypothetical protein WP50_24495 [Lactiplantibacillus plantarum]
MRRLLMKGIRFYQRAFSAFSPAHCRYYPTCSNYTLEALERLEEIAFTELDLHKVILGADVANQASRAVAERRQYHLDATLPENILLNGQYRDEAIYSLTVDEWSKRQDD